MSASLRTSPLRHVAALFRADTLAILECSDFDGIDGNCGLARQPKMAVLVARHDCAFVS